MRSLLIALCLLLLAGTCLAETRYVSDVLVVTVRATADNNSEILTTVITGAPLEVLGEEGEFLQVRTEKGVEGYIRSQYITKEIPKALQIAQLKGANEQLKAENAKTKASLADLQKQLDKTSDTNEELEKIRSDYMALQQASDNVVQITNERDQLLQENNDLTARMQQLKEENNLYLRTGVIKWFLAGAGVLVVGWVMGKISRKKKRSYI